MCSIVGSFSKDKVIELCELNAYRGTVSHSISYYDVVHNRFTFINRNKGPINYDDIMIPDKNHYCLVHMQAPTTDNSFIHPASINRQYLWHNGIIKATEVERLQKELDSDSTWDTELLLKQLVNTNTPEGVDGSFSCVYYDEYRLYLFRNEISPMFIDQDFNISSTRFKGSQTTQSNVMLMFEPALKSLHPVVYFNTVTNPYYFALDDLEDE